MIPMCLPNMADLLRTFKITSLFQSEKWEKRRVSADQCLLNRQLRTSHRDESPRRASLFDQGTSSIGRSELAKDIHNTFLYPDTDASEYIGSLFTLPTNLTSTNQPAKDEYVARPTDLQVRR